MSDDKNDNAPFGQLTTTDRHSEPQNESSVAQELQRLRSFAKAQDAAIVKFDGHIEVIEWVTDGSFGRRLEKHSQLRRSVRGLEPFELRVTGNLEGCLIGTPLGNTQGFTRFLVFFYGRHNMRIPELPESELGGLKQFFLEQALQLVEKQNQLVRASIAALLSGSEASNPFQTTLETLLILFQCQQGTIWEYHNNAKYNERSYLTLEGLGNQSIDKYKINCLEEPSGLVWRVLAKGAPKYIVIENTTLEDLVNKEAHAEYSNKPVVLIRLEAGDTVYGVACLAGFQTASMAQLASSLEMFQSIAALEIYNKRLERRKRILQRISEIVPDVTTSIADVCRTTASKIRELVNVEAVSMFLKPGLDPNVEDLYLIACSVEPGLERCEALEAFERSEETIRYRFRHRDLPSTIVDQRKPVIANCTANPLRFQEIAGSNNKTWVGVPINYAGKCVGILSCSGKRTTLVNRRLSYIFDAFDVFVLEDAARILSPILEAINNFTSLDSANRRLERAERIREHEMTAPLAAISANAEFVHKHINDSGITSRPKKLLQIMSDAEMCGFLVRESRVPMQAQFDSSLRHLSITELINRLASFLQRQIKARSPLSIKMQSTGVEEKFAAIQFMKIEVRGTASKTMLSEFLIQRALYNLGINAVKYGIPDGRLIISVEESADHIVIDFEDNGIGIDSADAPRVFEEGFRGGNTTGRTGEGLGLGITKEIIERHGGSIELLSRKDPTLFRVRLPVRRPESEHDSPMHPAILRMDVFRRTQK